MKDGAWDAETAISQRGEPFRRATGDSPAQSERSPAVTSANSQARAIPAHAIPIGAIRDRGNGWIPTAVSPSASASIEKVPRGNNNLQLSNNIPVDQRVRNPSRSNQSRVAEDMPGTPSTGSRMAGSPRESLVPEPLSFGRRARQKEKEQATESGWWGALESVIYPRQAEYDASNVV